MSEYKQVLGDNRVEAVIRTGHQYRGLRLETLGFQPGMLRMLLQYSTVSYSNYSMTRVSIGYLKEAPLQMCILK